MRRILWAFLLFIGGVTLVLGQEAANNLSLIFDQDYLIIYVDSPDPINLKGLGLSAVTDAGAVLTHKPNQDFDSLLLTDGLALPASCFIYVRSNTSPVIPERCSDVQRTFRLEVANVDVFWYDTVANRSRAIGIAMDDQPTGIVCDSIQICRFSFVRPTPGSTPVPRNAHWTPIIKTLDGVEMALVPAGCFMMGEGNEAHKQCFDKQFWIDRYEVTNAQYGSLYGSDSDLNQPRRGVSWSDAFEFCQSRLARLPTEKEWEYAARGPDNLVYPWGNEFIADNVTYAENSKGSPSIVGSRPNGQSWVGALDMIGNVWEWTSSIYKAYPYDENDGRENLDSNERRIVRGGSWKTPMPYNMSSAFRQNTIPSMTLDSIGFRCARDLQPGDLLP